MMQRPAKATIYRSAGTNPADFWLILTSIGPVLGHAVEGRWAFLEVSAAAVATDVVELGHKWRPPRDEEDSEARQVWIQFGQWWAQDHDWPAYDPATPPTIPPEWIEA